jgi:hypothetical protein
MAPFIRRCPRDFGCGGIDAHAVGGNRMSALAINYTALQIIPLREAVICAQCHCLSNATGDVCPACASKSLMRAQAAFERKASLCEWMTFCVGEAR